MRDRQASEPVVTFAPCVQTGSNSVTLLPEVGGHLPAAVHCPSSTCIYASLWWSPEATGRLSCLVIWPGRLIGESGSGKSSLHIPPGPGDEGGADVGVQVAGDAGVTALGRRGRRGGMSRPPVGAAVACTVPLWTVAMDETRGRPRPKPSWRGGGGGRGGGRGTRGGTA